MFDEHSSVSFCDEPGMSYAIELLADEKVRPSAQGF